jgi:hypothetical protein
MSRGHTSDRKRGEKDNKQIRLNVMIIGVYVMGNLKDQPLLIILILH